MLKLILILTACGFAAPDSLAVARFRADSTLAVGLMQQATQADSTAQVQRIQARTIWELAVRNLQRGQTLEEFLEPWLADADTHMGHNPSDDPEDQDVVATIFQKKATKAAGERQEAARVKAEQEAAVVVKPIIEGKDGKQK